MGSVEERAASAEIEAILSGGRKEIDSYLVRSVHALTRAVDDMPDIIAEAIAHHDVECRARQRRRAVAAASTVAAIISLATPFAIKFIFG